MFRLFRTLHAWIGALLALLVLLSSSTGTLLVWKENYLRLAIPAARADFEPTIEALAKLVAQIEATFDPDEILQIDLPSQHFALAKVTMLDARYAYVDIEGGVVDEWVLNERWEEWLYDLHHRLLLGNTGLTVVGISGLATMLLVILGLIAYWPFRRGFRLGLWPASGVRARLRVAHRNLGIVEALPFGLTLTTGIVLAFPTAIEQRILSPIRMTQEYSDALLLHVDDVSGGDSGDWLPAMRRAVATFPAGEVRSVRVANAASNYRIVGVKQPEEWHPAGLSRVYVDAAEGYMDVRFDATRLPLVERGYNAAYPLHTGKVESVAYKILLTASGIVVAMLSTLGLISFMRNRSGRRT
jgi:uncharacterized iron-regulated membrane protein